MWIPRDLSPRIERLASLFPVVVLTGVRQSGKTSLLRALYPEASFIALDLPTVAQAAETNPGGLIESAREPVIFDEVQYAPGLFRYIKAWVDEDRRPGRFLLSGSQTFTLMKGVSESLAGRAAIVSLGTLSSREILQHP